LLFNYDVSNARAVIPNPVYLLVYCYSLACNTVERFLKEAVMTYLTIFTFQRRD
jgi:hypothetical protein